MNLLSMNETVGVTASVVMFIVIYLFIHVKYIRHHALHKRFLAALWAMMKNTIHGEHIRTLGYKHEDETRRRDE